MGFFKNLFSNLRGFFRRVAVTTIGQAAEQIQTLAIEVVKKLASQDIDGAEKRGLALAMIRARVPGIATGAINLAIEMAWAVVFDALEADKK